MLYKYKNYISFFKKNKILESDTEINYKLKAEVLKIFASDPFKDNYYDRDMVMRYIKFIMSLRDKCDDDNLLYVTKLQEFREFHTKNNIKIWDAQKLDKKILGEYYGGRLWTNDYDYPQGVGIFTFK